MITIDPKGLNTADFHSHMLNAVAPRPIAFASTIDEHGNPNLAPFSFFNCFSSNPPILVFSANLRVRDNTSKDTFANIKANHQVVINTVSYNIVRQMSLASVEYPHGISEFEKAGFTPLASEKVKPFRVAEAPVQFECVVKDIIELGQSGGAGNLFICEIVLMHVNEAVLDVNGKIDPNKIDLCGRMGAHRYVRASGAAIFDLPQPVTAIGIGFDQLPMHIRNSNVLTGNDLAQLASYTAIPVKDPDFVAGSMSNYDLHVYAQKLIVAGDVDRAWQVLLA